MGDELGPAWLVYGLSGDDGLPMAEGDDDHITAAVDMLC